MKKLKLGWIYFLLAVVFLAACAGGNPEPTDATEAAGNYWPTQGWRSSAPESQGMDAQRMEAMLEAIEARDINLHSVLVIRNGYIVTERYYDSFDENRIGEIYSCTKSFISALVGVAIEDGSIRSIDERVVSFFPDGDFENIDGAKSAMSIEDLLIMSAGLGWKESDQAYVDLYYSPDWVKTMLDLPMAEAPGSNFKYCSGCSHLLSAILKQATGQNTVDYAAERLFEPLGIRNLLWRTDNQGISVGGWGLQITPRDMAKLGYLYLNGGVWDGEQIVPAEWVQASVSSQIETGEDAGYGYQWWVIPEMGAYAARGRGGQLIFVAPDLNLVTVFTADMAGDVEEMQLIREFILPAVNGES